ncbi:MAG: DUF1893 domain-containing protein [Alistipes sp.]|nr:DUF1893 domain-containing protein [Alistipes sp.]
MRSDIERAVSLLGSCGCTLAAVCGDDELTSCERGVKPLLRLLDSGKSLRGYSAADRVIGKAAAFLYVLLSPAEVYAGVISKPALETLKSHGINVSYDVLADAIRNRDNTGFCPMETAVINDTDPEAALAHIREKLRSLSSAK